MNLALWEWASHVASTRRNLPPIRIGNQAYGVLGFASPSDEVVEGLPQAAGRGAFPVVGGPLAVPLGRIARRWARAAEHGLADGDPSRPMRAWTHGPVPARLRRQSLIPVISDAIRMGEDAFEALENEWADRASVGTILNQQGWRSHGRLYRAFGLSLPVGLPMLGPGLDSTESFDEQTLDAFETFLHQAIGAVRRLPDLDVYGVLAREVPRTVFS